MIDIEAELHKIFSRTVARALGAMDVEKASPELKSAVKSAIWDTLDDVTKEIKRQGDKKDETILEAQGRT